MSVKSTLVMTVFLPALLCSQARAQDKDRLKPYPHPFPQIIQATDYPSIASIESLYAALATVCAPGASALMCTYDLSGDAVRFASAASAKTAEIVVRKDAVVVGGRAARDQTTQILFRTLLNVLAEVAPGAPQHEVRLTQFGTRAYKTRTVIEWSAGTQVVVLDSLSNGPSQDERLYVLDLIDKKDSSLPHDSDLTASRFPVVCRERELVSLY